MRYIFLFLLAQATMLACSGQAGSVRQSIVVTHYPYYWSQGKTTVAEVERYYDSRVEDVERDEILTQHQKKRMIRDLNDERKVHVKAVLKRERKESRHHWRYY